MKVFLVQAAQGEYDEKSWWAVAVWSSQALAEKHVARLNWCARQLREALAADPMPEGHDPDNGIALSEAAYEKQYDAWRARHDALIAKWRKLAGDENLDAYGQPTYSATPLPMRMRARKS